MVEHASRWTLGGRTSHLLPLTGRVIFLFYTMAVRTEGTRRLEGEASPCPKQLFQGTVLNVTYLEIPGLVFWPDGVDALTHPEKATGSCVDLYDMVAERLGLQLNILPLRTEGIVNISNSTFTATAYDIGMGSTDLAISGFYETPERRAWCNFVTPFRTEAFRLFTKSQERPFAWSMVNTIFKPFRPHVWAFITLQVDIIHSVSSICVFAPLSCSCSKSSSYPWGKVGTCKLFKCAASTLHTVLLRN